MVRIIKRGSTRGERVYAATCYGCDTKFEFKLNEATEHNDYRDGNYLSINCPVCGDLVTVGVSKWNGQTEFSVSEDDAR